MSALVRSSGDVSLDRQYNFVELLERENDPKAALELSQDICDRAPHWVWGWYKLGLLAQTMDQTDRAVAAWQKAVALDPSDQLGAGLLLHQYASQPLEQMPTAFVETLFDQYADRFDASLVGKLGYSVPENLGLIVSELHSERFSTALDLGCGTGLAGAVFRPVVDHLSGVDLSQSMLVKSKARKIYDTLSKADILNLPYLDKPQYDLIIAADVFIYMGALERVINWISLALQPNGFVAFSVESAGDSVSYQLGSARRYRHSKSYLTQVLDRFGLAVIAFNETTLRKDRGIDVQGFLVVAKAPLIKTARHPNYVEAHADVSLNLEQDNDYSLQ